MRRNAIIHSSGYVHIGPNLLRGAIMMMVGSHRLKPGLSDCLFPPQMANRSSNRPRFGPIAIMFSSPAPANLPTCLRNPDSPTTLPSIRVSPPFLLPAPAGDVHLPFPTAHPETQPGTEG